MHYKLTVCRLSLFLTCFCRSPGPSALSLTGENNCHKYAPPRSPPPPPSILPFRPILSYTSTLLTPLHYLTSSDAGTPSNGTHYYTAWRPLMPEHHRMGYTTTQPIVLWCRNTIEWDTLLHSLLSSDAGTPPNGTHYYTAYCPLMPEHHRMGYTTTQPDVLWCRDTTQWDTLLHSLTSSDAGTPLIGTHCYTA